MSKYALGSEIKEGTVIAILDNCISSKEKGEKHFASKWYKNEAEAEIYSYRDTVKAIEELRRDIILANGRQEAYGAVVGGRYAGTSIVERRATKLADSVLLREMERITRAIEDTYARAKEEGRREAVCASAAV